MRIIAGSMRGRRLAAPKGSTTRPTTDRVRESLFSALSSMTGAFTGLVVLDAFAGSGALGFEALSRGAARATFVEKDPQAVVVLKRNIGSLGVAGQSTVVRGDVFSLADKGALTGPFSLILLDAPYTLDAARISVLLETLVSKRGVSPGAVCSWEHAASTETSWPSGFAVVRTKRYGETVVELAVYDTGE